MSQRTTIELRNYHYGKRANGSPEVILVDHTQGARVELLRVDEQNSIAYVAIIHTPLHPGQME